EAVTERYDLLVRGGTAVLPDVGPVRADVAARDGVIVAIGDDLPVTAAERVIDARGKLVLPGAIDSHFHIGIYRPLAEDARSETASALVGGVTTVLSYFRTGSHYLNKTGPYREIYPEVLRMTAGNAHTDYGYHLAIMTDEQVKEIPALVREHGVGSFKFYMFYIGLNLAADSTAASAYTMADHYDLGHLYALMRGVAAAAREQTAGRVSLSIHCETADIIRACVEEQKASGANDLAAWSKARPPFSEAMAIAQATLLASRAGCAVNVLHISSAEALEAARLAGQRYPDLDLRLETTLHHLALTYDTAGDTHGKVNPPIRGADDVEAMWQAVRDGRVGTVASDHAACPDEMKKDDLWSSQPGFGGTALLYPVLISEGFHKRKLPLARIADLAAGEPARRFGLAPRKGAIAPGADADLAIVDPERTVTVAPELLQSAQPYTPFSGLKVRGWVTHTVLRGRVALEDGRVAGAPAGEYVRRPVPRAS
ncbi:MAG TPA: dihydroorotase family protein, partial [Candidatus Limnocylindria bacterium]|nr:dihydroorotase family protein [Candidatus Limnocylindria bacterium]